ncbi:MAG: branched-chain amino acid ABC transporter permease [Deltaproteobacteria bacterium]|nr:branched-chain amino acid ABC transporter permease [Deltaproteobacteria bacterium]
MADSGHFNPRRAALFLLLAALAVIPLFGDIFYTRLFTRIMIYAMAALSLDLILGYGGMVSLGHAAFLGVGAYTVGILSLWGGGTQSAFLSWPLAMLVSMLIALVIGAISLRTRGVSFIMITLAFAQMLYYCFISLKGYGGSDGMTLPTRSSLAGLLDISRHTSFYYLVLVILILIFFAGHRIVHSRFGMAIQGIRDNERRMRLLGFPTFRYKLVCFVLAAGIAGLAGALMANQSLYVGPALMHWKQSAEVLVMVILGGMKSLAGPIFGAVALLLAEEVLSNYTEHWMVILGPLLILVVLYGRNGIYCLLGGAKENG